MPVSVEEFLQAQVAQHPDMFAEFDAHPEKVMLDAVIANPWLAAFIGYHHLECELTIKAFLSRNFEWGVQFERLYHRPPTSADWGNSHYDRANVFADYLGLSKPYDKPDNRLRMEYGGPF